MDELTFLERYPSYRDTARMDELRATEYSHLDHKGEVYLDYTGAGVYAKSQLRAHRERLESRAFGNPHSVNPASAASTELVDSARRAILRFLNADPDEYAVIFTPNASGACRLVGEAYPFGRGRELVMTFDNHNSVNGIREFARRGGSRRRYIPLTPPDLRIPDQAMSLRGGTVAFNLLDPDGHVVDERLVATEATAEGLSLRTGCFCNPGAGEGAFDIGRRQLRGSARWGVRTVDDYLKLMGLPTGGAIRVSFGVASTFGDVRRLLDFLESTYRDRIPDAAGLEPRERC